MDPISTTNAPQGDDGEVVFLPGGIRKFGFCIIHAAGKFGRREMFASDEMVRIMKYGMKHTCHTTAYTHNVYINILFSNILNKPTCLL